MIFVYRQWDKFCRLLDSKNIHSITAAQVLLNKYNNKYLVLKHDVETAVEKAYRIAKIEHKYGHRGSYYVQAYLLKNKKNITLFKSIQDMGHEVSYHYDVMDQCKGKLDEAIEEFKKNVNLFESNGFSVITVCQHGNPVIERIGYTSNRDFFRNEIVQKLYYNIADIMVDFKTKAKTDYLYFSDAGRTFNLVYDPINNDIIDSSDKNISYDRIDQALKLIEDNNCIISIHPHRWSSSIIVYYLKNVFFNTVRFLAKKAEKIPALKKFMSKYYFLAKRI